MISRPLLLGEAPACRGSPSHPFDVGRLAVPTGSGARLAAVLGVPHRLLGELFDVKNLLEHARAGPFPLSEARAAARLILETGPPKIVMCGRNVCRAFGFPDLEWCRWTPEYVYATQDSLLVRCVELSVIPHPSGLNRFYNHESNRLLVRRFLREACGVAP